MNDMLAIIARRMERNKAQVEKRRAEREAVWASIETSAPGLASFMKQIAAETGKPAAVRVVIDGKVLIDTGMTK